ncbi:hypothetical protein F5X68DRAFT_265018 [Plectosphaerella plurivora]|uniref:Uncharacterized protein n=1 Tax=Plectosphaerella plurivora TaxID=936078 RepID=A0A9P8V103_9PEZI|nr:hypothetical protein F5X68DRAFT_265018 [Plectosphaerella plurivora]
MADPSTGDPRQVPLFYPSDKTAPATTASPSHLKPAPAATGSPRGTAVWINLTAAFLLAALLGAGAFVSSRIVLIDDHFHDWKGSSTSLGPFAWGKYIPAQPWNIGVALIGTAVGILAALAFSTQDDFMTRRALASDEGCPAMFLRPLTPKRGVQQILRGMLSPERTLLFLLTSATAITSAATIAVFSLQQSVITVIDPRPSYPLQDFNVSFFRQGLGNVSPAGSYGTGVGALGQFAYKSAYINGLIALDNYDRRFQDSGYQEFIQEPGQIGFTAYPNISTGGVGLNVASYTHRTGNPVGFDLPHRLVYTLDSLQGDVYGTTIEVTCIDTTDEYVVAKGSMEDVEIRFVSKPGGPNITVMWDAGFGKTFRSLAIGSAVWGIEDETSHPTLTLAVSGIIGSVWVAECTYAGHEYLTEFTLSSADGYIQTGPEKATFSDIGPRFKQTVANATNQVIEQGMGGALARGFIDSRYNEDGSNTTDLANVLSTVLSQIGEAHVSLLRQDREFNNADPSPSQLQPNNKSHLTIRIRVHRMGGASYGWLAVYGVFFLGCILGLVRIYSRARTVAFEAQDAVKLLTNVYDPNVNGKTRLRYEDRLSIVGR